MTAQSHQRDSRRKADRGPAATQAPEQPGDMREADIANGERPTPTSDAPLDTDDQRERRRTTHTTGARQARENRDDDPPA